MTNLRLIRTTALLSVAAVALTGCNAISRGIGVARVTPDEFLTVSTAPLSVPPEYGLRPPSLGQPRPQELAPESAARQILLGQRQSITRTPGEQALITAAGADQADPLARYVVDDEFGDLAHKDEGFANRLMFWRKNSPETQTGVTVGTASGEVTIDAEREAARLGAMTGGSPIALGRRETRRSKLPGL